MLCSAVCMRGYLGTSSVLGYYLERRLFERTMSTDMGTVGLLPADVPDWHVYSTRLTYDSSFTATSKARPQVISGELCKFAVRGSQTITCLITLHRPSSQSIGGLEVCNQPQDVVKKAAVCPQLATHSTLRTLTLSQLDAPEVDLHIAALLPADTRRGCSLSRKRVACEA
jgi:hypothetical protein